MSCLPLDSERIDRDGYDPLTQRRSEDYLVQSQSQAELDADVGGREWRLAFARTTIGVTMREGGTCRVEESVYGAALAMPQLARTVGWDKTMTALAIRSVIFLVINIVLQAYLLKMIAKEEIVMDMFGGQMWLCDFGADLANCPGPGCRGPGGTDVSAARLYSWDAIVNRNFVKDSMKAVFPDKIQEINDFVDPGEYGVESYWCRLACCFIFMISCMDELVLVVKMGELIFKIPTKAEPWIRPRPRTGEPLMGKADEVELRIAGMPLVWKCINLAMIVAPKAMLWKLACETGITFLMETAGMADAITNSVGLAFILSLDELIAGALMSEETSNFVANTADFELFDAKTSCVGDMSVLSDDEILAEHAKAQAISSWGFWDTVGLIPNKLVAATFLCWIFVWEYYYKHCVTEDQDGIQRYISKEMHVPSFATFDWCQAFLPAMFPLAEESEPYWKMPEK